MMDMCNGCSKLIKYEADQWWQGYEKPKTKEDELKILRSKSREIIFCNDCTDRFKEIASKIKI